MAELEGVGEGCLLTFSARKAAKEGQGQVTQPGAPLQPSLLTIRATENEERLGAGSRS